MPYRTVILGLWLAGFAYWVVSAVGNKRTTYRLNPVWKFTAILCVLALAESARLFPVQARRVLLPQSPASEAASVVLTAAGIAFAVWARRTLGRNWSGSPVIKEGHELVQTGPYGLVRHPIYSGIVLAAFGTCLGFGRVRDLETFAFIVVVLGAKLKIEESLMKRQFPEAYPDYMKRTKALIPFVW